MIPMFRRIRRQTLLLALGAFLLSGCWGMLGQSASPAQAQADAQMRTDSALATEVNKAKAQADANPGDVQKAVGYAELLGAAYESGTIERGRLNGSMLLPDAQKKLAEAADTNPDKAAEVKAVEGSLLTKAGQAEAGMAAFEESMEMSPNLLALSKLAPLYATEHRQTELDEHCEATREVLTSKDEVFFLMSLCTQGRPGMTPGDAMPWASSEDIAFYQDQLAIEQARIEEERQREAEARAQQEAELARQRELEAQQRASSTTSSSTTSTSTSYRASISVSSDCDKSVKVFEGSVSNGYTQSGTHGSHSSNSIRSYTLTGNDQLCILTDSGDIISCIQPPDGSRYEITESCSGFMPR